MKIEQSFAVLAPAEEVWAALNDVERVAPCLPGATLEGRRDDGVYEGTFSVKLGPATATYEGTLDLESSDESTKTSTMRASGRDKRGQGSAKAVIVSHVRSDEAGGTRVDTTTELTITGRLARFGRGAIVEDVSNKLMAEFAQALQTQLNASGSESEVGPAAPSGAVSGVSLFFAVLRARLRRLFRRDKP